MSGIIDWIKDVLYNKNDPRTNDWFLATGPGPILMIIVSYIYFSVYAGPRYMKDKKPYNLKNVLIVYNFIQILLSIYLFVEGLLAGWLRDYSFRCQPVDYSNNPKALRMARVVYGYYICKLIELLDTVFFVLRKKNRQISALHIYHHTLMPFAAWIGVRYVPGGHVTLLGIVNSFIHIIMYTYYMLSAFGPSMQKYLWWKRYLTVMQLTQFTAIMIHNAQHFFNDCDFPRPLAWALIVNSLIFIYMFSSFYIKNYIKIKREDANVVLSKAEPKVCMNDKMEKNKHE